jgi:hypothetical protein
MKEEQSGCAKCDGDESTAKKIKNLAVKSLSKAKADVVSCSQSLNKSKSAETVKLEEKKLKVSVKTSTEKKKIEINTDNKKNKEKATSEKEKKETYVDENFKNESSVDEKKKKQISSDDSKNKEIHGEKKKKNSSAVEKTNNQEITASKLKTKENKSGAIIGKAKKVSKLSKSKLDCTEESGDNAKVKVSSVVPAKLEASENSPEKSNSISEMNNSVSKILGTTELPNDSESSEYLEVNFQKCDLKVKEPQIPLLLNSKVVNCTPKPFFIESVSGPMVNSEGRACI